MPAHRFYSDMAAAGIENYGTITDPGTGAALPTSECGMVVITTGASGETNTLADPVGPNLVLDLVLSVDGGGDRVVTAASAINQSGNTVITMNDAGDHIRLLSIPVGTAFKWRVVVNNGTTLS